MEIPQEDLGGDMMGDESMPPMDDSGMDMGGEEPMSGPDDMGGEDPMAGGPDDMGGAPDDMGVEDPTAGGPDDMGEEPDDMGGGNDHEELMQIADQLDTEDEAALIKYGKSMVGDSAGEEPMMPESRINFSKIIDETISSLLDKKNDGGTKRPGKKLNSKQRDNKSNPFVSPY